MSSKVVTDMLLVWRILQFLTNIFELAWLWKTPPRAEFSFYLPAL